MRFDLIMNFMLKVLLLAPALVIGLDLLTSRQRDIKRLILAALSLAGGIGLLMFFESWNTINAQLFLLAAGTLAIMYAANWLTGLPKYLALFSGVAFLTHALARQLPGVGIWGRYQQLFNLPVMVAAFIIPLPLAWHLWHRFPLALDTLRNGSWHETGVPLAARYKLLATIAIAALSLNVFLFSQLITSQETVRRQINISEMDIHNDLRELSNNLHHREQFENWHNTTILGLRDYRRSARRLNTLVSPSGVFIEGAHYFITETVPEGMREALLNYSQLTDQQYQGLIAITEAFLEIIDKDWGVRGVTSEGFVSAANAILKVLQDYDLLDYFDIKYRKH